LRPKRVVKIKWSEIMATRAGSKKKSRRERESPDANDLLILELQEIHSAETQLARQLPRLSKAVESASLREMLDERLEEGERIIGDIENALEEIDASPGRRRNVAAEGLINDAREHVQEIERGPALDSVLIGAMQKTEHYCIAAWGTARALAQALEQKTAASAMERALKEGSQYDEKLTRLAEKEVTPALLSQESESEEMEEEDDSETEANGGGRGGSQRGRRSEERANR
jgi:ferritin-like metal-binding protein YciE